MLSPLCRSNLLRSHRSSGNLIANAKPQPEEKSGNMSSKRRKTALPMQELVKQRMRLKVESKISKSLKNMSNSRTNTRIISSSTNQIKLQTLHSTSPSHAPSARPAHQRNSLGLQTDLLGRLSSVLDEYHNQLSKERKEKAYLRKENLRLREKLRM